MTETSYWVLATCLPGLALAVATGYATGAGCYAANMNCLSVVVPDDAAMRALFATAAFLPFGLPSYLPLAVAGLALLATRGVRALERAVWLGPALYTAMLHAACVWFAAAVLPARRVTPTLRLDLAALAVGYAWVALALAAKGPVLRLARGRRTRWAR